MGKSPNDLLNVYVVILKPDSILFIVEPVNPAFPKKKITVEHGSNIESWTCRADPIFAVRIKWGMAPPYRTSIATKLVILKPFYLYYIIQAHLLKYSPYAHPLYMFYTIPSQLRRGSQSPALESGLRQPWRLARLIISGIDVSRTTIAVVYSSPTRRRTSVFLDDWEDFLHNFSEKKGSLVVGDFNVHVERPDDRLSSDFLGVLEDHGWKQMVNVPTHKDQGTLDLVITRDAADSAGVTSINSEAKTYLPDHFLVSFRFHIGKSHQHGLTKTILSRSFKDGDIDAFVEKINQSELVGLDISLFLDELYKHGLKRNQSLGIRVGESNENFPSSVLSVSIFSSAAMYPNLLFRKFVTNRA
eukprot:sb/3466069/